jgi:hypothetical protein
MKRSKLWYVQTTKLVLTWIFLHLGCAKYKYTLRSVGGLVRCMVSVQDSRLMFFRVACLHNMHARLSVRPLCKSFPTCLFVAKSGRVFPLLLPLDSDTASLWEQQKRNCRHTYQKTETQDTMTGLKIGWRGVGSCTSPPILHWWITWDIFGSWYSPRKHITNGANAYSGLASRPTYRYDLTTRGMDHHFNMDFNLLYW